MSLNQILSAVHRRVMLSIARAVVRAVNDDTKMQSVQAEILKGEVRNNLERFQNYGYTSVPHPGAEAAIVFVGGNRDHGLIVAVDDRRYRLKGLQGGEVAMYTDEGDYIHFKRDNVIDIKTKTLNVECETATVDATTSVTVNTPTAELNTENTTVNASTKATINSPETEITGNLTVGGTIGSTGNISSAGDVSDATSSMQDMRDVYNGHTHPETGSTTQVPTQEM